MLKEINAPLALGSWGLAALLLMMTACMLALFGNNPVTGHTVPILRVALQEIVPAIRLLAKGFSPTVWCPQ